MKKPSIRKTTVARKTQKNKTFEFGVFNLTTPPTITEPKRLETLNTDYIPFGKDNLFPQYLAELKRKSSTHRSVLAQKTVFTSGAKFVTSDDHAQKEIQLVAQEIKKHFKEQFPIISGALKY